MICIHEAIATPVPRKPGEFDFKIISACQSVREPPAAAHAGLFGGAGDAGLFKKGARYG